MNNTTGTAARLYYLDWLRVLAMIGIFFFHNARFYDTFSDWHVKNATTNIAASGLIAFMSQWIMPLFFIIAGAGTYLALKARRPGQYIQERTLRLLIPLIFGMLVIVVPQAYFQALYRGENLGGYNLFQIYWLYLQTLPDLNWFHLWFLVDLFIFSIIALPLFNTWGGAGKSIISRLAAVLNRPWALLLLLVCSLAIVNIFIFPGGDWGDRSSGGWNIVAYLLFFVSGYLILANPRIMEGVTKLRWIFLSSGIIAFLCLMAFFLDEMADPVKYFGSAGFIFGTIVQALSTWSLLLAILGLGNRFLNLTNKFLTYSNEAVLPFYILHQTVIISIGFYVVQWSVGIGVKYLTISTASFIAIMLIYELLVKRINILRFLFGMRRKRKQPVASAVKG
jgi:glucan biosynthesis protein C